jgi:outer membrane lipase/esterase
MKSIRIHYALFAAALAAASLSAQAQPFTGMFVFGDSLSDSGNNAAVIGSAPGQVITGNTYVPTQPYGLNAYTNGTTWVNTVAAGLGLPLGAVPSLATGGNYAYGGAKTVLDGSTGNFPPSATTQLTGTGNVLQPYLQGYLTGKPSVPSTALYVIAIGGNDVRDLSVAVATGAQPPTAIAAAAAAYATAVGSMVDALQAKGAQRIVVWDTPNVGKTPAALAGGPSFSGLATNISSAFNAALFARMSTEPASVSVFDVFGITNTIIANPGAYGLTNVTDACGAVLGCNPSQSLFWDGIHPTSAGHALIASAMLAAVPEPASMLMLAVGICGLLAWRRRP